MATARGLWSSALAARLRGNPARCAAPRSEPPPHHLLELYDYEGSPWCRLVREYATILDLTLHIKPCPRQTLFQEGAFSQESRFRPEAMELLKLHCHTDDIMFPILVDRTYMHISNDESHSSDSTYSDSQQSMLVLQQSYSILEHLWEHYGQSVVQSPSPSSSSAHNEQQQSTCNNRRPDQVVNSSSRSFPLRFLSLAAPSYLRPWPHCGLFRVPKTSTTTAQKITLYQSEGCPESRLVRELLCSLEIPYQSIPVAVGSHNKTPNGLPIPVMTIDDNNDNNKKGNDGMEHHLQGAAACLKYLQTNGGLSEDYSVSNPAVFISTFLHRIPKEENEGRQGNFAVGAYTAFLRGSRAFVPPRGLD